jgi:serine/threonine protein kinase
LKKDIFLDEPVFDLGLNVLSNQSSRSLSDSTIGSYQIHEKIGSGGMGEVYRAVDTKLNRVLALKFLTNLDDDKWAEKQFLKEAQAAAMLDHSNICIVYGIEESEMHNFIVMQYIKGRTLASAFQNTNARARYRSRAGSECSLK